MDQLCDTGRVIHIKLIGGKGIAKPFMGAVYKKQWQPQPAEHFAIGLIKQFNAQDGAGAFYGE